ncbi:hypothetical protein [Leucothrix mucor]|uniref:hypothetical protein n=1 Tax=Leucothrix mucor TaxID=45248 RepID=UPI0003B7B30B|nr:hypothetical protein [Leucothrix mucor]
MTKISAPPTQWEVNISILNNPLLWFQLFMVALISSSYLALLLVGFNLFEHAWDDIPVSLSIGLLMAGGLFVAFSLILFLMYWRGVPTRYVLHDGYIEQHTLAVGKKTSTLLSLFGLLSGKSTGYAAAGATLLARSREQIAVNWKEATSIKVFPRRHEIQLYNEWQTIMQVVCPEDQFDNILNFIQQQTENKQPTGNFSNSREMPFSKKIIISLFSLIFGFFLFPRLPIHYVGIFSIATIGFAFMALWSSGLKQRIFGGILTVLPILGSALAYFYGEIDMSQQGATYALLIELFIFLYFTLLGVTVALRLIR